MTELDLDQLKGGPCCWQVAHASTGKMTSQNHLLQELLSAGYNPEALASPGKKLMDS